MFKKATNFRVLPSRRTAPGMNAPANDNRRDAHTGASRRARAPRLVCRWSLSANTGRPVCRWEMDNADEPSPGSRKAAGQVLPFTKLSSNCLIKVEQPVAAMRPAARLARTA